MEELTASAASTEPMANTMAIHSVEESPISHPARVTHTAAKQ